MIYCLVSGFRNALQRVCIELNLDFTVNCGFIKSTLLHIARIL